MGLIALQLAALRGAQVITTTSKQHKVDALVSLGIEHVVDHRSDFDAHIKHMTQGRGVDAVLNMLSGEAIQKGLNSLAAGGRYLEIAVHALKTSQRLDLTTLTQNQAIHSIDIRRLASGDSHFDMQQLLAPLTELLAQEHLVPIVSRVYPLTQMAQAMQYVSQGQHIGKVVISHSDTEMQDLYDDCLARVRQQRQRAKQSPSLFLPRDTYMTSAYTASADTTKATPTHTSIDSGLQPIAVIGMSGQFQKPADVDTFWANIRDGKNCISEIPPERWDNHDYYQAGEPTAGKTNSKWMGVLENYDQFDPLFFNIAPTEAELMDPQQRVFLQNSWWSIENAATYNLNELAGTKAYCRIRGLRYG